MGSLFPHEGHAVGLKALTEPDNARTVGFTVTRHVCIADEYEELRERLPQLRRRGMPALPAGHTGLIAQAVSPDDFPLRTVYGSMPTEGDAQAALDRLEDELRRSVTGTEPQVGHILPNRCGRRST